ncbi:GTPase [Corynebacterium sp. H78]|uniref:GTPase n=1 Tax=Corynebacterium sp. H78 TaxID=3133417 RepID=UPI0030B10BEE
MMDRTQQTHIHAALQDAISVLASVSPQLAREAQRIQGIIDSPPRIVIVGRLKAGKSTLVNALIGVPVAETAALEATNVVAVYQNGAPARAEAVLVDGSRREVETRRGTVSELPVPATEISYLQRWFPSAAIADYSLVDTPGLATLTSENESRTRRVLIDGYEQTRVASVDADAAVFLFDSTPRADEIDFLKKLRFTPFNTLGVLSRADGFGEGALGDKDPIEHAAEHSKKLATALQDTVMTVIPIAGLLAETSHTGALTEDDARQIAGVAHMHPFDLIQYLDAPASGNEDQDGANNRRRLLSLVGEYGFLHGRDVARGGAAALNEWLVEKSGIPQLRQLLAGALGSFATIHRASRILREIDQLAYVYPERERIRSIASTLRTDPRMMDVSLFEHLKAMLEADPYAQATAELRLMVEGTTVPEKLGLHAYASGGEIHATAMQKKTEAQMQSMSTLTAAEDAALVALMRAYDFYGGAGSQGMGGQQPMQPSRPMQPAQPPVQRPSNPYGSWGDSVPPQQAPQPIQQPMQTPQPYGQPPQIENQPRKKRRGWKLF